MWLSVSIVKGFLFFLVQQGPKHIDSRVEEFLKTFENKLYEMTDDEFKVILLITWSFFSYIREYNNDIPLASCAVFF